MIVILGTLIATAMPVLADPPSQGKGKGKTGGMPFQWKATSPAIQEGDRYDLAVTNTGNPGPSQEEARSEVA